MKKFISILFLFAISLNAQGFWEQTNGPYSCQLFIKSTDDNRLYARSSLHGLFFANGPQDNWEYIHDDFNYDFVQDFVADGNGLIVVYSSVLGTMISYDNGVNWQTLSSSGFDANVKKLYLDLQNNIYLTNPNLFRWNTNKNVWDTIYNSPVAEVKPFNNKTYALAGSKIIFSEDYGKTWATLIDTILNNNSSGFIKIAFRNEGDFFVENVTDLYHVIRNEDSFDFSLLLNDVSKFQILPNEDIIASVRNSLMLSLDNGLTWKKILEIKGGDIWNLAADSNGNILCATFLEGFVSSDYGLTWKSYGVPAAEVVDLKCYGNYLFSISKGDLFSFSSDKGITWQNQKQFGTNELRGILVIDDQTLILVKSGGIDRTTDRGASWVHIAEPGEINDINISPTGIIYATLFSQIAISRDYGLTWKKHSSNVFEQSSFSVASDKNGNVFLAGQENIYRSTDEGVTWQIVKKFPQPYPAFSININENGDLFVGTIGGGLFRSVDNCKTFDQILFGNNENKITSIVIDESGNIYAAKNNEGIYKSSDNGNNWQYIGEGLNEIKQITLDIDKDGYLFAGTYGNSIYRSSFPVTGINDKINNTVTNFSLSQNYPNPFNPVTQIKYNVPDLMNVSLAVFDILGNKITTLIDEQKPGGEYEVKFESKGLTSGIYFYKIQMGGFTETRKMILLK